MTVTVYRSTDSGAPFLNAMQGSFINVLRKCLVDGYGAKSGAGWTMPYIRQQGETLAQTNITFTAVGKTITRSTGSFVTDGFYSTTGAQQLILVSGSVSNNGLFLISTTILTALTITLDASASNVVTGEAAGNSVTIKSVIGTFKQTTLSFVSGSPDTIHRSAGSFLTDGYQIGNTITVYGAANGGNNTTWTIAGVTASDLTLTTTTTVTGEAAGNAITLYVSSNGPHKAVFKMGGGNLRYFQIMNEHNLGGNGTTVGGGSAGSAAQYPCMVGYESMSAMGTGTIISGATSMYALALTRCGASYLDTTARNWVVVADNKTAHIMVQTGEATVPTGWSYAYIGDITSYVTSDTWNTMMLGQAPFANLTSDSSSYGSVTYDIGTTVGYYDPFSSSMLGHWLFRNYAATAGGKAFFKAIDPASGVNSTVFAMGSITGLPYPYGINSAFVISPIYAKEYDATNKPVRGYMRGLWGPCHNAPAANNDTFSGTGVLVGKTFEVYRHRSAGTFLIETSDTWSA